MRSHFLRFKLWRSSSISLASLIVLFGCGHPNQVKVSHANDYKQIINQEGRYQNAYPGKQSYPFTCDADCYQQQVTLQCQAENPAEQCRYTGTQPNVQLNSGFKVRWFGHASFEIVTNDGKRVLLDPVSQQFDWPVNWGFHLLRGFSRGLPPGLTNQVLANPDAVLYSHIHYDHFNKADIERIGNRAEYLVPLGFADHFPSGAYQINEMGWYAQHNLAALQIHAVPAHHFSNRILVPLIYDDFGKSSWNGWIIQSQGKSLFFAGDTGYSPHFKDIRRRYGAIDVCLLPIASYYHKEDGERYRNVHTTPEDALSAAVELGCKVMIPWGYGSASWKMGDHSTHSALQRLLTVRQRIHDRPEGQIPLIILNEGEEVTP
ncbi:MBL fold metallo-hydrolase [Undibacterium fentianense]|uniref:MBL fold metallo-hydrolase n=1 Tax=Undibacterium fentianense TaxID=2828728 RepID=A0A941E1N0_9BURK|nr:MBL fold metallo-hydrolase [Undibacterium fentianense]MBR7799331.1 MBL fold metallo-hydrolase [Undibacterium fentianense]